MPGRGLSTRQNLIKEQMDVCLKSSYDTELLPNHQQPPAQQTRQMPDCWGQSGNSGESTQWTVHILNIMLSFTETE